MISSRRCRSPLLAVGCGQPFDPQRFHLPESSAVGLFPASSYAVDFADLIFRGFRELGISIAGRRVLLKPNMVEYEPGTAINTHPHVVAGAAIACKQAGASEVVVGEGPGHRRDIEYLLASTGLSDQLREQRIRFVDLNHDDVAVYRCKAGSLVSESSRFPSRCSNPTSSSRCRNSRAHHWAGMTCSMKNLFGPVPRAVYGWPKNPLHVRGIPNSILDLTATIRPHFAIVDAVTAMEGDGPIMGRPRPLGFVAMGSDPVAVDAMRALG